jgi:hypothetical protein
MRAGLTVCLCKPGFGLKNIKRYTNCKKIMKFCSFVLLSLVSSLPMPNPDLIEMRLAHSNKAEGDLVHKTPGRKGDAVLFQSAHSASVPRPKTGAGAELREKLRAQGVDFGDQAITGNQGNQPQSKQTGKQNNAPTGKTGQASNNSKTAATKGAKFKCKSKSNFVPGFSQFKQEKETVAGEKLTDLDIAELKFAISAMQKQEQSPSNTEAIKKMQEMLASGIAS